MDIDFNDYLVWVMLDYRLHCIAEAIDLNSLNRLIVIAFVYFLFLVVVLPTPL